MLRPMPIEPIPPETARVARAAFPKGNRYLRVADELETLFTDDTFLALFPTHGQPAHPPWRLALVTILQFAEGLSDRQAAHAVRSRIDWKYVLRLELTDPGFDASVLSEFRARLIAGRRSPYSLIRCSRGVATVNSSKRGVGSGRTPRMSWPRYGL
jgi:transposase